jgi:hypothetical protein
MWISGYMQQMDRHFWSLLHLSHLQLIFFLIPFAYIDHDKKLKILPTGTCMLGS